VETRSSLKYLWIVPSYSSTVVGLEIDQSPILSPAAKLDFSGDVLIYKWKKG